VVQGWPQSQFQANRKDVEGTYMKSFALAPEFAERMHGAKRETRFVGTGDLPGFFLKPYGPGGRSSGMPATTSTRSRRSESPTPSVTPKR
jgi:hypothetical protein